jgi:hypothetical protein
VKGLPVRRVVCDNSWHEWKLAKFIARTFTAVFERDAAERQSWQQELSGAWVFRFITGRLPRVDISDDDATTRTTRGQLVVALGGT